jgi:hypothetical protein
MTVLLDGTLYFYRVGFLRAKLFRSVMCKNYPFALSTLYALSSCTLEASEWY